MTCGHCEKKTPPTKSHACSCGVRFEGGERLGGDHSICPKCLALNVGRRVRLDAALTAVPVDSKRDQVQVQIGALGFVTRPIGRKHQVLVEVRDADGEPAYCVANNTQFHPEP